MLSIESHSPISRDKCHHMTAGDDAQNLSRAVVGEITRLNTRTAISVLQCGLWITCCEKVLINLRVSIKCLVCGSYDDYDRHKDQQKPNMTAE